MSLAIKPLEAFFCAPIRGKGATRWLQIRGIDRFVIVKERYLPQILLKEYNYE